MQLLGLQEHGGGFLVCLAPLLPEELDERVSVFCRVEQEGLFENHGGGVGGRGDVGCGGGK